MPSSCLVSYTTEERHYAQAFYYNRRTDPGGGFVDQPGFSMRDVTEVTTFYKGTHADVETALRNAAASATVGINNDFAYELHKSDGPWWEGTFTTVEYGEWQDSEEYYDPTQSA